MTYAKCDTNDTIYDNFDDTCATVLETLVMSVKHVFMVIPTHLCKDYPLKPPKLDFCDVRNITYEDMAL